MTDEYEVACRYTWPLLDPNPEDVALGRTHQCCHLATHDSPHRCACGEVSPNADSGIPKPPPFPLDEQGYNPFSTWDDCWRDGWEEGYRAARGLPPIDGSVIDWQRVN